MQAEKRRALVQRLQTEARAAPRRYLSKVLALALAGYAALLALLLFAFGLPLVVVATIASGAAMADPALAFPVLACLALGGVLLRALWMRFEAPAGHRLAPDEAPELQTLIERLRVEAGAPPLDGIVIDGELNAAAAWVPRLAGLLGHRHYLVLGLPLMSLLDRAELASVIAHEFGHFSEGHGRLGGWIYRARASWYRVLDGLAAGGGATAQLLAFVARRYVPYFNAYSFVLAREQEHAADAAAVRASGAPAAASALVRLEIASKRLQLHFWPELLARARSQRHPPLRLHADLRDVLRAPDDIALGRLLAIAQAVTDPDDTHPALAERVQAMGVAPVLRRRDGEALDTLLGPLLETIERSLDLQWRSEIEPRWSKDHAAATIDRARLEELDRVAVPSTQQSAEHARLLETLGRDAQAAIVWRRLVDTSPGDAAAHHRLGALALRQRAWESALTHLQQAIALDPGAVRPTLAMLDRLDGDPDADANALQLFAALRDKHADQARALALRDGVAEADALIAHNLDAATLRRFTDALAASAKVRQAWMARKAGIIDGDPAHYVLLVDWRGSVAGEAAGLEALAQRLPLPGSHTIFTGSGHRDLARRVRASCGAPVYRRGAG